MLKAPARLHAALLNESGYLGRVDGSIGFVVPEPYWEITVSKSPSETHLSHLEDELRHVVKQVIEAFSDRYGIRAGVSINAGIPLHVGLGAKTSLLMGVGNAISLLFDLYLQPPAIASLVNRGGTSGIGVWASARNGFLWDAGRRFPEDKATFSPSATSTAKAPQLVCNIAINRYAICHFRFANKGVHGAEEEEIFRRFCPLSHEEAIQAYSVVSGGIVPALLDGDEPTLQRQLHALQGIGLKRIEWSVQSDSTKRFRTYWESAIPDTALCLSSMGPTLYCLTEDQTKIEKIINNYPDHPLHFTIIPICDEEK